MKEEKVIYIDKVIFALTTLILVLFLAITCVKLGQQSKEQQETIIYLESELIESEVNKEWIEDYIDVMEEIWEKELEIRVLENEIKWLSIVNEMKQSNIISNQQVYDDFEVYFGLLVRYFNDEITIPIEDYIQQQNPLVYARIQQYEDLWG
jgi:hypothetical protein